MYRTDFWTLWEKARVGCFERTASKHIYYLGWNRSPAQAGCMRQVLGPGALGRPRGIEWRGRWEGGSGWQTHVNPWLIHVNVWQKPVQYCKVISLQLIKKKRKKKKKEKSERLTGPWVQQEVKNIKLKRISQKPTFVPHSVIPQQISKGIRERHSGIWQKWGRHLAPMV